MGKQVRKYFAWTGMVESHIFSNNNQFRVYRWTSCKYNNINN